MHAEVPEAELTRYTITLRSLTAGTGRFTRRFARHELVPASVAAALRAPPDRAAASRVGGPRYLRKVTVTCNLSLSLDGYVAGPRQSRENPLGEGAMQLHQWHFTPTDIDQAVVDEWQQSPGAYVMGRNMFGPIRGEWDEDWQGWWGPEPPYHAPVFVLTHHPRDPLPMEGGTTFHFVTDGIEAAVERAQSAAGGAAVEIAGGAATVNAALQAGLIERAVAAHRPGAARRR